MTHDERMNINDVSTLVLMQEVVLDGIKDYRQYLDGTELPYSERAEWMEELKKFISEIVA